MNLDYMCDPDVVVVVDYVDIMLSEKEVPIDYRRLDQRYKQIQEMVQRLGVCVVTAKQIKPVSLKKLNIGDC